MNKRDKKKEKYFIISLMISDFDRNNILKLIRMMKKNKTMRIILNFLNFAKFFFNSFGVLDSNQILTFFNENGK